MSSEKYQKRLEIYNQVYIIKRVKAYILTLLLIRSNFKG